jgi:hypothetical protein
MSKIYTLLGIPSTGFSSHPFTTSWLLPPLLLSILRLLFSIYCFTTIFYIWAYEATHSLSNAIGRDFSYFTALTWWGLAFYLLISGIHTLVYSIKGRCLLDTWPRPLQALHSLFYTTVVTFPFLVTIVYWAILYSNPWFTDEFQAWSNISRHGLNSFFALFELLIPSTNPPPALHIALGILLLACYLALAYITQATQGFYTYSFLDPSDGHSGRVAGYVFGIAVGFVVLFGIVWGVIWLRRRLTGGRMVASKRDIYRGTEFRPRGQRGWDEGGDAEMSAVRPK